METAIVLLVGVFFTVAIYLILSRTLIRVLLGIALLGNGINLMILAVGRLTRATPPIVPAGSLVPLDQVANPLPQALILTAIVIGFGMFAFLLVLAYRAYQGLGAEDTDHMRVAEPVGEPRPPLDY